MFKKTRLSRVSVVRKKKKRIAEKIILNYKLRRGVDRIKKNK